MSILDVVLRKFKKDKKEGTSASNDSKVPYYFDSNLKLGFGFNRLPFAGDEPDYEAINDIVDEYLAAGGKYFETAYNYMKHNSETIVRKCLVERYPRDQFVICDKMPIRFNIVFKEGFDKIFDGQLKKCGVDYFDVYLLHNVSISIYDKLNKYGAFDFLKKIKQENKAKLVGFSFHDKADVLDRILTDHPEIDIVQLQINYQDWDSPSIQARQNYEVAKKHGKMITVMEPLKGGNLVNRLPKEINTLLQEENRHPADLGLRWVASLESVNLVLSGMGSVDQVKNNTKTLAFPYNLSDEEYALIDKIREGLKANSSIDCTSCGYCLDVCPKNIPVNEIFDFVNNETRNGKIINRNARMFYSRSVEGRGKAKDCIQCGACEKVCSQMLPIREHLKQAAEIFEAKL